MSKIHIYIYIYIERERERDTHTHTRKSKMQALYECVRLQRVKISNFKLKNDRSEPFNLFSVLNSCIKLNFIFFKNFLLRESCLISGIWIVQ
jgi:hypothetical protein